MSRMEPEEVQLLVRLLRASRGWSQGKLGRKAGVDVRSILRFEKGQLKPADETVERLIAAVGLPVDATLSVLPPVIRLIRSLVGSGSDREQAARPLEGGDDFGLPGEDLLGNLETASGAALSVLTAAFVAQDRDDLSAGAGPAPAVSTARQISPHAAG